MPIGDYNNEGFNVGQDLSLTIRASTGEVFRAEELGHLEEFDAVREDNEVSVKPLTNKGIAIYEVIPHGHSGKMVFSRYNGKIAALIADLDKRWRNGIRTSFDIQVSIDNRDGTIDEYMFKKVRFSKMGFGNFKGDKPVDHSITFKAQSLIITGGTSSVLQSTS